MVKTNIVKLNPQATAPAGLAEGEVYYNSTSKKLQFHDGTASVEIGSSFTQATLDATTKYYVSNSAYQVIASGSAPGNSGYVSVYSKTFTRAVSLVRIGLYFAAPAGGGWTGYYQITKNGTVIKSGSTTSTTQLLFSVDTNILQNDIISVDITSGGNATASASQIGIYGSDIPLIDKII